jgi:hypothetical protein
MTIPPLAAIFLTHFDDIKGQTILYYRSLPNVPATGIEHKTLPSGLHLLTTDEIYFTHHELPGIAVFRSRIRPSTDVGRGRRMASLGVVLEEQGADGLFSVAQRLEELWDELESLGGQGRLGIFGNDREKKEGERVLDRFWKEYGDSESGLTKLSDQEGGSNGESSKSAGAKRGNGTGNDEEARLRELLNSRRKPSVGSLLPPFDPGLANVPSLGPASDIIPTILTKYTRTLYRTNLQSSNNR